MMTVRKQFRGNVRNRRGPARTMGALAGAIALAAMSLSVWPGQGAGAAIAPAGPPVKYYVVHERHYLQTDFLRLVAARTLGNASLYTQIFSLNVGRLQPDGKRLENAGPVGPGWILVLPPAAHGPLVHFGPLPLTGAAARSALSLRPALPTRPAEAAGGSTGSGAGFAGFLVAVLAGPSIVAGVVTFLLTRRSRRPVGRHQLSGDPDF
ncbi:MAG TPA: hypothetical protein VKS82_10570 [Streptosporangiaceae bacterium]|nr:hypothetical protein [Streptosporangiaceae bacterium]